MEELVEVLYTAGIGYPRRTYHPLPKSFSV
jgi:hypothetical protein